VLTLDLIRSGPCKMRIHRLSVFLLTVLLGWILVPSLIAQDIRVTSPTGTVSGNPSVWIRAHAVGCDGQPPVAFGYSVDNSTTFVRGVTAYDIDTVTTTIAPGSHVVHFKSWTRRGLCPVVNSTFTVGDPVGSDITVAAPISGKTALSPLWVRAHSVGCNGLQPVAFGYSIDNGTQLVLGTTAYDIDVTNQPISAGPHTVHFKSWTRGGLCPVVDTSFVVSVAPPVQPPPLATPVSPATPPPAPVDYVPSNAILSADLESASNWEYAHDPGTPGDARGSTIFPATTPSSDTGREFAVNYSYGGGEIYHVSFGTDVTATHFVYDAYVYLGDPSQVQNVEMDMNQVMANGATVIFGTQCASGSRTWEFTTVRNGATHWWPSNVPCNPQTWTANAWHHVQIASHRDNNGVVTYDWVDVDGTHSDFQNASGPSALQLGWKLGDLLINFQLDGVETADNGAITAYLHKTNIYRW
jgi:hypothetical protein